MRFGEFETLSVVPTVATLFEISMLSYRTQIASAAGVAKNGEARLIFDYHSPVETDPLANSATCCPSSV